MAAIQNSSKRNIKQKQYMLLGMLLLVVVAIAVVAGSLGGGKPAPPPGQGGREREIKKAFGAQGNEVQPSDQWRITEGAKLQTLQTQLNDALEQVRSAQEAAREARDSTKGVLEAIKLQKETDDRAVDKRPQPPQTLPPATSFPAPQRLPPAAGGQFAAPEPIDPNTGLPMVEAPKRMGGIMRMDLSTAATAQEKGNRATEDGGPKREGPSADADSSEIYLPTGSFFHVVLLGGMDAPTSGQGQSNPIPVLMKVLDLAQLPNKFKADVSECFLTGNGQGDLSSERAYIRLDRMSCVKSDGTAIDIGLKGYVADESGKAGMRGRLVTKQGQVLANALLAGVASGIGQAFTQSYSTTSQSPLGTTSSVNSGKEFQAGISSGVGKGVDRLAQYYLQLADKLHPIIEIDAGREADVVVTRGVALTASTK
jgi:conjugal transfer pilus assembly protein TraB